MPIDLSVVITTFNSSSTIRAALDSLQGRASTDSASEVIVVDNHSSDGSADAAASYDGVTVVRNAANEGLARANNRGAAVASGRSLFFINPDVVVLPGCLRDLSSFETGNAGSALLGPATLDDGGAMISSARSFPTPLDIALRRSPLGRLPLAGARLRSHMWPLGRNPGAPARVDWLVGAAIWLTAAGRDRVGLMSERFFLYFEDVEWAWRAHSRGMGVWLVPDARVRHECRRESAGGLRMPLWHHLRSMLIFYSGHPSALTRGRKRRGIAAT
ncbi:glycosyltransferase family 2 protein [Candidatus Fermentibacterales bacterium]|nr:glycosyltransferase family 2 protein [Candidatus Fermentibacterales bacterium]